MNRPDTEALARGIGPAETERERQILHLISWIEHLESQQGEEYVIRAGDFDSKRQERPAIDVDDNLVWTSQGPGKHPKLPIVVRDLKKPEPRFYAQGDEVFERGVGYVAQFFLGSERSDTRAQVYADWLNAQEAEK